MPQKVSFSSRCWPSSQSRHSDIATHLVKDASSSKAEDWYEVARNHFQGWSPSNGDSSPGAPHIQSSGRSFHLIVPPACECDQEPTLPRSLHTRTPDAIVNQLSRASIGRCLSLIQKSSPWSKQNNTEAEDAKQTTEAMQEKGVNARGLH